jgi:histone deacetylase 1/2
LLILGFLFIKLLNNSLNANLFPTKNKNLQRPRRAQAEELASFHGEEYLETLRNISPAQWRQSHSKYARYGLDDDCPIFPGLFDYCRLSAGASIEAAAKLNAGQYDIAINWAGGLHHAKKSEASGFCYINDCVLGILELLKVHPRVLYIDLDIHHGDGVEEAFYTTDRVMTLSLHLYRPENVATGTAGFFPGTGALSEIGEGSGRGYSVNVPLVEGCTDEEYLSLFKPILERIMQIYKPGAVVLQCGADALVGDRIGAFSLTLEGHAEAVRFVKSFNLPMIVLGGGGYTKTTVARAWTLDTATVLDVELEDSLPTGEYYAYFAAEPRLRHNLPARYADSNKKEDLERIRSTIMDQLKQLKTAPGAGMDLRPPEALLPDVAVDDEQVVHERLKEYTQEHFKVYFKCVEDGTVDPFAML